jgi:hypothetical protein
METGRMSDMELENIANPRDPHLSALLQQRDAAARELSRRRAEREGQELQREKIRMAKLDQPGIEPDYETCCQEGFLQLGRDLRSGGGSPHKGMLGFIAAIEHLVRTNTWRAALGVLYENGFFVEFRFTGEGGEPRTLEDGARLEWFAGGDDPRDTNFSRPDRGMPPERTSLMKQPADGFIARMFGRREK